MKLYLSRSHSDEDDSYALEGKYGIIISSKEDLLRLCDFFANVKEQINNKNNCHMHFRDSFTDWDKEKHIDIEVNID